MKTVEGGRMLGAHFLPEGRPGRLRGSDFGRVFVGAVCVYRLGKANGAHGAMAVGWKRSCGGWMLVLEEGAILGYIP